jgi:hypothetical protein
MLRELQAVLRSPGETLGRHDHRCRHRGRGKAGRTAQAGRHLARAVRREHGLPTQHERVADRAAQRSPCTDAAMQRLEDAVADQSADLDDTDLVVESHPRPGSAEGPSFFLHSGSLLRCGNQQGAVALKQSFTARWLRR